MSQTFTNKLAVAAHKDDYDILSDDNLVEMIDAGLRGGLVGAGMGGSASFVGGVANRTFNRDPKQPEEPTPEGSSQPFVGPVLNPERVLSEGGQDPDVMTPFDNEHNMIGVPEDYLFPDQVEDINSAPVQSYEPAPETGIEEGNALSADIRSAIENGRTFSVFDVDGTTVQKTIDDNSAVFGIERLIYKSEKGTLTQDDLNSSLVLKALDSVTFGAISESLENGTIDGILNRALSNLEGNTADKGDIQIRPKESEKLGYVAPVEKKKPKAKTPPTQDKAEWVRDYDDPKKDVTRFHMGVEGMDFSQFSTDSLMDMFNSEQPDTSEMHEVTLGTFTNNFDNLVAELDKRKAFEEFAYYENGQIEGSS
ncbi:MAG: hypothetical protein GY814_20895, partial [Gammaproteobacteria bacterium]|nr:hypothetical protein [Gammaproteobacteria bacterium]